MGRQRHPAVDGKKPCIRCGEVLPFDADHFTSQPDKKIGRRLLAHCRKCHNIKSLARSKTAPARAQHREDMRTRRATPEGKLASDASSLKHRRANASSIAKRTRAWVKANPDRVRAWNDANRDKRLAWNHEQRAKRAKAPGKHTAADIQAQFNAQVGMCFYCVMPLATFHIEHKTPLSRGGTNWPDNIVCACAFCNLRKHDKTAAEFLDIIHAEQTANDRAA